MTRAYRSSQRRSDQPEEEAIVNARSPFPSTSLAHQGVSANEERKPLQSSMTKKQGGPIARKHNRLLRFVRREGLSDVSNEEGAVDERGHRQQKKA